MGFFLLTQQPNWSITKIEQDKVEKNAFFLSVFSNNNPLHCEYYLSSCVNFINVWPFNFNWLLYKGCCPNIKVKFTMIVYGGKTQRKKKINAAHYTWKMTDKKFRSLSFCYFCYFRFAASLSICFAIQHYLVYIFSYQFRAKVL